MKKLVVIALAACFGSAWVVSAANARKVTNEPYRFTKESSLKSTGSVEGGTAQVRYATAAANTTLLASYQWNSGASCITQGWVTKDMTVQVGDFVHVDDFAGLAGGDYGLLVPLAGAKSMWIGSRVTPANPDLCGYAALPGYGNGWQQLLCSSCFTLSGNTTVSYLASWDSEPGYDFTFVEYDAACNGDWTQVETVNGGQGSYDNQQASTAESFVLTGAQHGGSARIRFNFIADTAYSDSDGLWNTDGAFIVDNIVIQDGTGTKSNSTFEAEAVGAHGTLNGHWNSCNFSGYGNYAGLLPGQTLLQQDPCARDISCLWAFFNGSTANYSCGGFPAVTAVPYGNSLGQYLTNEIWSPLIPWTGSGTEAILQFAVYRDLPLDNLVVYVWQVRSIVGGPGGCPQSWLNDNTLNYGDDLDWLQQINPIGPFIDPAATHIQISLGAWDVCGFFCGTVGSGACHSHAPLFDNVTVKRVETAGPQWLVNGWELFQDNFATNGTVTGSVRIDAANDILPAANANILPGDSASATVVDPVAGIGTDPGVGGPSIYAYVRVDPPQASKSGNALTQDATRWPVVGSVVGPGGLTWWKIRFDQANVNGSPVPDVYCVDLNDVLFQPGDMIEYFYEGISVGGAASYFFGGFHAFDNFDASGAVVTSTDINVAYANPMEVTCLPRRGLTGGDILYVDDGDGRAVQPFFDQAFQQMGILDDVDRYDTRAPSSVLGNGPGARVVDVLTQITPYYKKILWNSEELEDGTIGDGTGSADKGDDFAFLFTFLNNSTLGPGLYISGDGIADDWSNSGAPAATNLRSVYLNFNLLTADHKDVGLGINPKGIAVAGGAFAHPSGPDTLITFGGCLGINEFDVLTPTGSAISQMRYNGNPSYSAVISQTTTNANNAQARVMMAGFSFDLIRDDRAGANGGIMDRVHHLYDVITFLQNTVDAPTDVPSVPRRTTLAQNYPNPFNPSTSIEFTVRNRMQVSIKVYNVAGQLVRDLLQEERAPGVTHRITWDGRDDAGQSVSSGVYFYRLVASDFTQTKKMVLLK